jgi:alanyl-tRNA synthetase
MTAQDIRRKYLEFFKQHGHTVIPSASLVPENDPTVLFTTAGMHPLVPYLLGQTHPGGKRLVNFQKSLRTDDIDEVGDSVHNTFFEMLGNWSLGDYWKDDSIKWSYEFLTGKKWLGLDTAKLAVSVFTGDAAAPRDEESAKIWKSLGIGDQRIAYLGKKDNWWGPPGVTGPCGPDTEMFFWTGTGDGPENFQETHDDPLWVEVWNNVFMEYDKQADGRFLPLKQRNVDTGMGLERMTAVMEGKQTIYDTELFLPILEKIRSLAKKRDERSERIVADHLKAATFIIADGVVPSNKDRGYILRRLIRRAVRYGQFLGIEQEFCTEVAAVVIHHFESVYPELRRHEEKIVDELAREDLKFRKTLTKGLKEFEKMGQIDGKKAFDLFQTYGFPWELTEELAEARGQRVNREQFEQEFEKHQALSRTSSAGRFKGGLADSSMETTRLHTTHHLLLKALQVVLGPDVKQRGSNITAKRLRIDFSYAMKLTDEQKQEMERIVNEKIGEDLPVIRSMMPKLEAERLGAEHEFGQKYPDQVSVYSIGPKGATLQNPQFEKAFSIEFCGGPHVEHTGQIGGKFKITKEEAVAAGIRRIKGIVD